LIDTAPTLRESSHDRDTIDMYLFVFQIRSRIQSLSRTGFHRELFNRRLRGILGKIKYRRYRRINESGMYFAGTINRPLDLVEPLKYIGDFYALYTNRNVVFALYYSTVKL
jgi:hypothetical protein